MEGVTGDVPEQASPIKPAWQRWNDYGIACLLEGGPDAQKGELRQAEAGVRATFSPSATRRRRTGTSTAPASPSRKAGWTRP